MSDARPRRRQRQRRPAADRRNTNLWRPVPPPDDPAPINPAQDPTALLRSLGPPPLKSQSTIAEYYLAAVVTRAARIATALAATADLLGERDES